MLRAYCLFAVKHQQLTTSTITHIPQVYFEGVFVNCILSLHFIQYKQAHTVLLTPSPPTTHLLWWESFSYSRRSDLNSKCSKWFCPISNERRVSPLSQLLFFFHFIFDWNCRRFSFYAHALALHPQKARPRTRRFGQSTCFLRSWYDMYWQRNIKTKQCLQKARNIKTIRKEMVRKRHLQFNSPEKKLYRF